MLTELTIFDYFLEEIHCFRGTSGIFLLVNYCLMHDKCFIDYPDQKGRMASDGVTLGVTKGVKKGGETQINRVLAPCHI